MTRHAWVVCRGPEMVCLRCGETYTAQLPARISVWVATARAFERAHAKCAERKADHV